MKGKVTDSYGPEKAFILATKDNTYITVTRRDGTISTLGPYSAGQEIQVDMFASNNDYYVHILGSEPIYVFHVAGFGNEMGGALLPTVDGCTGSLSVNFVRSKSDDFYLNLMTRKNAINRFYISIDNGPATRFLDSTDFEQVGHTEFYVLKDVNKKFSDAEIPTGSVIRIYNKKDVFHLGVINGKDSGGGCIYGYFSNYNPLEGWVGVEDQANAFKGCDKDSIVLKAEGGLSYVWSPTDYLDNPYSGTTVLRPPPGGFSEHYSVQIEQPCNGMITLHVWVILQENPDAFFTVSKTEGCAPFQVEIKDASTGAEHYVLDVGNGSPLNISNSPIDTVVTYENNTDTIIDYYVTYSVKNSTCWDYYVDTIRVYPEVKSDFELVNWQDSVGCNPLTVDFRNKSTGNTDKYLWYFGDGATNSDTLISHTYQNIGKNDTIYPVKLIAISPYNCRDTSTIQNIRVHPYINAIFSVDSTTSCSPIEVNIDPLGSVGVDTFYWHIKGINNAVDSIFTKLSKNPIQYIYTDKTLTSPDTINVSMYAANRFGCQDTATSQQLIVFPEVKALFDVDT